MARIICLANSYKHGGRCIAGIDQDTGKWIRPVPDSNGGAVISAMRLIDGKEPQILDVIEIPISDSGPDEGCQPENRTLNSGKWKKVGRITAHDLLKYCEDDHVILHNNLKYVSPDFSPHYQRINGDPYSSYITQMYDLVLHINLISGK